jgi:hypothetical protein
MHRCDAILFRPVRASASSVVVIAAMPEENSTASSPPSIAARNPSAARTVGLS